MGYYIPFNTMGKDHDEKYISLCKLNLKWWTCSLVYGKKKGKKNRQVFEMAYCKSKITRQEKTYNIF